MTRFSPVFYDGDGTGCRTPDVTDHQNKKKPEKKKKKKKKTRPTNGK